MAFKPADGVPYPWFAPDEFEFKDLKLYVFEPKCLGPSTFVVMETSEERARAAVRRYCRKEWLGSYETGNALLQHVVMALSVGEVFSNPNE